MTLPSSGTIKLSEVNVELGNSSTSLIGLGQTSVRNLAGVPTGTIKMSDLYGKSAVQVITFDGSAWNGTDWNLRNVLTFLNIPITSTKVEVNFSNLTLTSTATSIPALETGNGWPTGTQLTIKLNSGTVIQGKGGTGGTGGYGANHTNATSGTAGGAAMRVTGAISGGSIAIINAGSVRGGGGGGGGGGSGRYGGMEDPVVWQYGGTGGSGQGPGAAGAGEVTSSNSGDGGNGGGAGAAGATGGVGVGTASVPGNGGAGGAALLNSSLATLTGWVSGSTYNGALL